MYRRLRPLLFRLNPETAHAATLRLLQSVGALPPLAAALRRAFASPTKPVHAFGLTFTNPLGLAAGYDKDGLAWRGLATLGFGHIEVGTVTLRPQPGNPRPRLFRLQEEQALINRLGFPSRGAAFLARRLAGHRPPGLVLGVNIGLNKDTLLDRAAEDYADLQQMFNPLADYIAVNISSPNTAGLRELQEQRRLSSLLESLAAHRRKPLLVKLSPDMDDGDLCAALDVLLSAGADGVILTNTTTRTAGVSGAHQIESGGISGRPLADASRHALAVAARHLGGRLPIISVGGILGSEEANRRLQDGATLVQLYTGLIYKGPGLVHELLESSAA